ncbi:hypothetical protein W03_10350 [Nitrosomonas sp. PY1]|uniref:phage tail protein n=1 Tax=Nitrosomonas sp. PY1 TaxID=1803906 RepID=UPI001FC81059|nr:phage tail protein [Nitrosomonas sp. PY1]GKS69031.1 hypothetical protein W03_10350 [Nitrosomonas sp. PY1]
MDQPVTPVPSSLMNYLPGIYREDPFLGRFLFAFEQVLLGVNVDYTLELISVKALEELPKKGVASKFIVAIVNNDALYIRVFSANGMQIVDKAETRLTPGNDLTWLKKQVVDSTSKFATLSAEQKAQIIKVAAQVANFPLQVMTLHGIEERIATIHNLFNPAETPSEFLPWLASWVAFAIWADISEEKQRGFIANMMRFYRWRGTKKNLKELFVFYVGIESPLTFLNVDEPHYFKVLLNLSEIVKSVVSEGEKQQILQRQIEIAHALIHLEKPAHTYYDLELTFPSFRIGKRQGTKKTQFFTQVGKNTRLGAWDSGEDNNGK